MSTIPDVKVQEDVLTVQKKGGAKRQAAFAERKKMEGLKKVTLWLDRQQQRYIKAFLKPSPVKLPDLIGSPAQVKWAKEIQRRFFYLMEEYEEDFFQSVAKGNIQLHTQVMNVLQAKTHAKYWIENRNESFLSQYKSAVKSIVDAPLSILTRARFQEYVERDAYINQITLLPELGRKPEKLHQQIEVKVKDHHVRLLSSEYDEEFNALVKKYGFVWDQPHWSKEVPDELSTESVAATIVSTLLNSQYACVVADDAVRESVSANTFTPEPGRILTAVLNKKEKLEFKLSWLLEFCLDGKDLNFLGRLSGSHLIENRVAFIPERHYAEVMDLCERNEFFITQVAKDLASAVQSKSLGGVVVKKTKQRSFKPSIQPDTTTHQKESHGIAAQFLDD